ncbi:MAG: YCF48-related protein, partial [Flavobacteriales bacterium]
MKKIVLIICLLPFISYSQSDWYEIEIPTNRSLSSVYFVNSTLGFIGGDSILLNTVDGGMTWNTMNLEGTLSSGINLNRLSDMHWFSVDHGIITQSPYGGFFETTNGGETWNAFSLANSGFCQAYSLFFFDENNGFAGGAGCFQGELIDRFDGEWSTTVIPDSWDPAQHINEIDFMDSEVGFAASSGGLFKTSDGGLNWGLVPELPDYQFTDIVLDSSTDLYMPHNGQWGILESTDGGETWEACMPCATFFSTSLYSGHKAESGVLYFGGGEGFELDQGILFEKDGFTCYYEQFDHAINSIGSHDNAVFIVGDSGMVYTNNPDIANKVENIDPVNSSLIYPNPCSEKVTIEKSTNEKV